MANQKTILIVEDSYTQAERYALFLQSWGYEVFVVETGPECLAFVDEQLPDAIFLDIHLPGGMDGYQICQRLQRDSQTRHIPIIMLTSATDQEDIKRGYDAGARGYIAKGSFVENHMEEVLIGHLNQLFDDMNAAQARY